MDEANKNLQQFKPKWCKYAIASFLIPCISIVGSFCFILIIQPNWINPHPHFEFLLKYLIVILILLFALPFLPFLSFIMGIWSFFVIIRSRSFLKGYIFAFLCIIISVPAFMATAYALGCKQNVARVETCQYEMTVLYKAIAAYGKTHNNKYPAANEWCDLIIKNDNNTKGWFLCCESSNINREPPYKCSYAINPKAEPNSASDVVLLFETKEGWNQFGGPELMTFDNHYRKGCNVLFNDGRVKFIKPKQKDKLKWGTTTP